MDYQVALITGAASGLGREVARLLAQEGIAIAALDVNRDGLACLKDELTRQLRRCAIAVADVTQPAQLQAEVAGLEQQLGPIDLLLASAGIGRETSALQYSADDMNAVLNVNLLGVSNSIAAVLPGMLTRRRGHLVALSSLASYVGMPRMLAYCASKAGVNAIMEAVRVETARFGIHVTTICPGWIRTPMTEPLVGQVPMLELADAAQRIFHAIRRRRPFVTFPTGMVWQVRLLSWMPRFLRDRAIMARVPRISSTLRPRVDDGQSPGPVG